MEELKKHKILLSLLSILIAIKFLILPYQQWQESVLEEITSKKIKLEKVKVLIANKSDFESANKLLNDAIEQAQGKLFINRSDTEFELENQIALESIFKQFDLDIENFGWQTATILEAEEIKKFQVQVRFSGELLSLVNLTLAIESHEKRIDIANFNFNFRSIASSSSTYMRGARMTLNLYMNLNKSVVQVDNK